MASREGHQQQSINPQGLGSHSGQSPHVPSSALSVPPKRTRVLLSCHPCRSSKLKCNRATPCGQCLKRGKPDACAYAPRIEKSKPAKTMAARLRRLEGMVRGMVELDSATSSNNNASRDSAHERSTIGSIIHSERATNYVGGTHFMAILEDLEDLKAYFEEPEAPETDVDDPHDSIIPCGLLIDLRSALRNKEELLALLPDKNVMDRLMNRYFNSNSPSQHIIHVPTFTRQYNEFLQDRHNTDIHWIATLFMILALGIFFSTFQAPHELELDSPGSPMDRFRQYRDACGWALLWGNYAQPGPFTLHAMILYTEAEFLANRNSQMNCYLLCSTLIRLMLKMGLHRDPDNLPRITPYQGEMRRRIWNLAVQLDLLVAFHLGLPCMIHGIESDTALPRNLLDSDFGEDSTVLPPSRPMTDYTPLTYPINKARIVRGFGLVARLSHSLTLPTYAEVMRVDAQIQDVWSSVPPFMKIRPLSECITDVPMVVIQRFGLASLYQKSRCVLHRRYLVDPHPLKEHDYSRRTCLEAALALLDYQITMFEATKPGAILAQNRWFIASLAINDFLLADMVVALAAQQQDEDGPDWMATCTPSITKTSLIEILKHSYTIWKEFAITIADCRKAANVVRTMLRRIQTHLGISFENFDLADDDIGTGSTNSSGEQTSSMADTNNSSPLDGYNYSAGMDSSSSGLKNLGMVQPSIVPTEDCNVTGPQQDTNMADPWGASQTQAGYDWNQFDAMTRSPMDMILETAQMPSLPPQNWLDQNNFDDSRDFLAANSWNLFPGM
ncbi:hypothetical protein F5Y14DRAFT_377490 [Nemania sp. NC0429]|nr:hypothetical protein F5Y14DRAFT_377490 [Nemania sp. NC0429]